MTFKAIQKAHFIIPIWFIFINLGCFEGTPSGTQTAHVTSSKQEIVTTEFKYETFKKSTFIELLSNDIIAISSANNYVYIGSQLGLNIFDRTNWQKITNLNPKAGTVYSNVSHLLATEKGVWAAAASAGGKGLISFVQNDGTIARTYYSQGASPFDFKDPVSALLQTDGFLFVAAGKNAFRVALDGTTDAADIKWHGKLHENKITALGIEPKNKDMWIAGKEHIFIYVLPQSGYKNEIFDKTKLKTTQGGAELVRSCVGGAIWQHISGMVAFGHYMGLSLFTIPGDENETGGFAIYNPKAQNTFEEWREAQPRGISFTGIAANDNESIFMTTAKEGLYYYNANGETKVFNTAQPKSDYTDDAYHIYLADEALPSNFLTCISIAKPGHIWIGTQNHGVVSLTIKKTTQKIQ